MSALPLPLSLSLEHLPLLGYFALIALLLGAVAPNFSGPGQRFNAVAGVFILLALASVGSTWYYMLKYFERSFIDSAFRAGVSPAAYTTKAWLADVSLFHEAWAYVCDSPQRWWWTEQLCLWTVGPLTLIMGVEGRRHGIKRPWAFMLLGQIVAVSSAQSLFFAALALSPSEVPLPRKPVPAPSSPAAKQAASSRNSPLTWSLLAAVILGNASVAFAPGTLRTWWFLPNLLGMHAVLLVPLFLHKRDTSNAPMTLSRFYLNLALISLRFRAPTVLALLGDTPLSIKAVVPRLPELFATQWETLNSHPAQQSIGWDVLFASLSGLVFLLWTSRAPKRPDERVSFLIPALLAVSAPFVGVSTAVGVGLAVAEGKKEATLDAEERVEVARKEEATKSRGKETKKSK
ncbi:hypothetical protein JCM8097_002076 [Rhodosporidiobolus ruineniae]